MQTKEDRILEAALQLFLRHGYRKVNMSEIAEATQMSRPSLYAAFANKEAIFAEMVYRQCALNLQETAQRLPRATSLRERLACIFDIWLIEPVASVIDSENAAELLANCAEYAPAAVANTYARMEQQLVAVLDLEAEQPPAMPNTELAHLLRLATTSMKASAENLSQLRKRVEGLTIMAVATLQMPG